MRCLILFIIFALCSCSSPNSKQKSEVEMNIMDSLRKVDGLTELCKRTYFEKDDKIIIYNYRHSGDGVFEATIDGDLYKGRLYTLRGDATNPDATVYQLIPFVKGGRIWNYLYKDGRLERLTDNFERVE